MGSVAIEIDNNLHNLGWGMERIPLFQHRTVTCEGYKGSSFCYGTLKLFNFVNRHFSKIRILYQCCVVLRLNNDKFYNWFFEIKIIL